MNGVKPVGKRIWIVDGHNVIFAIPRLERLQVSGRGGEAREGLVDTLRRFALPRRQRVLIVFDGDELARQPEVIREPFLEVTYTRRSEGGADVGILREARSLLQRGHPVTVVTNDVSTLARELPDGVEHLGVRPFWRKYIVGAQAGKRVAGDFSDLESEMLALAAVAEPAAALVNERKSVPSPPGSGGQTAEANARRQRILVKKARGRARQERRLMRRLKPGRG
jgi:predicted RNA-binding protein with PIN domain